MTDRFAGMPHKVDPRHGDCKVNKNVNKGKLREARHSSPNIEYMVWLCVTVGTIGNPKVWKVSYKSYENKNNKTSKTSVVH